MQKKFKFELNLHTKIKDNMPRTWHLKVCKLNGDEEIRRMLHDLGVELTLRLELDESENYV